MSTALALGRAMAATGVRAALYQRGLVGGAVAPAAAAAHNNMHHRCNGSTSTIHGYNCACCQRPKLTGSVSFDSKLSVGGGGGRETSPSFSTAASEAPEGPTADIEHLLSNNRKWVASMNQADPEFFTRLGKGQSPKYMYVGCSDSRVPVNQILGLQPGSVFVHRNVGNLVVGSDLNVLSGIDFAVDHLKVDHIIVTGHYDCGAVKAAATTQDLGLLENWVRSIRDVYRLHRTEIDTLSDGLARHRRLVELNVMEQCLNLYKTGTVQRRRKQTFEATGFATPRIHALVFDPGEGLLHPLPVDFKDPIGEMSHIYNLYATPSRS